MKFKKLLILILFSLFSYSCAEYSVNTNKKGVERKYFASSGFALIYKDELYNNKTINKKIDNNEIVAIHSILKRNTKIKIFNPSNSKIVETVVTKKANYPGIFNVLISERIANILDLDRNNPFVEIIEVKKNKTFVAKKSNTYDEEKNVAEKAPVDEIKMDDLSSAEKNEKVKKKLKKTKFNIIISDFYYIESAKNLKNELIDKTGINNISIIKINDKKYRLLAGPFKNFNALKTSYISLNNLGFENLNINKID